nr:histidine kinase [Kineosporia babensis]
MRRPRRWSELSRVERVGLYTRQSLYLVLWGMCGGFVLSAAPSNGRGTAIAAGAVVITALGSIALKAVMEIYPQTQPFPWRETVALSVACAVYLGAVGLTAEGVDRATVAILIVANLAAGLGGLPDRRYTAAVTLACAVVVGLSGDPMFGPVIGAVVAAFVIFTVRASLWLYGIVAELDAARHTQARLAVAEERLRFSRDVHDVLGRRLSTIAVQAELAATLAGRGDERAATQMMEVRQVAHDALTEARELARGYRPTSLSQELEGARSLLRSAGIEVGLEIDVVPRAWHEAAGWVVREGVTNVLRHSSADLVRISYQDHELRIENDGLAENPPGATEGSGLRGLGERLLPLGAEVEAGRDGENWVLVARLPGTGPLSATVTPSTEGAHNVPSLSSSEPRRIP